MSLFRDFGTTFIFLFFSVVAQKMFTYQKRKRNERPERGSSSLTRLENKTEGITSSHVGNVFSLICCRFVFLKRKCWIFCFLKTPRKIKCSNGHFLQCKSEGRRTERSRGRLSAAGPSARWRRRRTRRSGCCCRGWSWFAGWPTCIWGGSASCTCRRGGGGGGEPHIMLSDCAIQQLLIYTLFLSIIIKQKIKQMQLFENIIFRFWTVDRSKGNV